MAAEFPHLPAASWLQVVQQLLDVQRPQQAEQLVRRHLRQHPHDAHAHGVLALALTRQHRLREAYSCASEAIVLDPQQAYGFYMLSLILIAQQQPGSARRAIQKALRLAPQTPAYLGIKALLDNHFQRHQLALDATITGLALDPTHKQCLLQRIAACQALAYFDEAANTLRYLARHHPTLGEVHRLLGQEALRQWHPAEARLHLREALRLDPNDDLARYALAQAARADLWLPRQLNTLQRRGVGLLTNARRGRLLAWALLPVLLVLTVVLAVPLLVIYGLAELQWRLHPDVRYLRYHPTPSGSYLQQALRRYGPALALLPALAGLAADGVWLALRAGLLPALIAPGLAWLTIVAARWWLRQHKYAPTDVTTPRPVLGWLLLALVCGGASLFSIFQPATQPYGPVVLLLLSSGVLFGGVKVLFGRTPATE